MTLLKLTPVVKSETSIPLRVARLNREGKACVDCASDKATASSSKWIKDRKDMFELIQKQEGSKGSSIFICQLLIRNRCVEAQGDTGKVDETSVCRY